MASRDHAIRMGDLRFERPYEELRRSADPARFLRAMSDDDVVAALASASRHQDPYLANTLATETINRVHRLRAATRNLGEGVLTLDMDGLVTYANPAAARLLDVAVPWLVGRPFADATGLDDPHALDAARVGRTESNDAGFMRRADGSVFPVQCTWAPVISSDPDGGGSPEVEGVVVAFADITARKQAEADVRLRSVMLRALGEAVVATDADARVTFWNPAAEALFGWPAAEILGRPVVELVIAPDAREQASRIVDLARGGAAWTGNLAAQRRDGARIDVSITLAPVTAGDGALLAIVAVASDITERLREEREMRFRSAVLESIGEAVTALDAEDRYVYWNAAAERMTGWRADEVIGRRPTERIVRPEQRALAEEIAAGLQRGEPWSGEGEIVRKDGSSLHAKVTAVPVPDAQGRIFRVVGTWADITETENARRAVEGARAFLQSTLDGISLHVAVVDERGVIIAVNRAWREFADENGLAMRDHGLGASYLEVCERAAEAGSEEAARDSEGIRAALAGNIHEYLREYPCHGPTQRRWFVLRATAFRDAEGRPFAVISHANVTAVHRVETISSVLEAVAEATGTATFATTLEGETLIWNEEATALFGYPAREALGRPVDRLLDGTPAEVKDDIRQRVDRGEIVHLPRAHCRGAGGREILVDLTLSPVRDRSGSIVAVSAVAVPVKQPDGPDS